MCISMLYIFFVKLRVKLRYKRLYLIEENCHIKIKLLITFIVEDKDCIFLKR